MYELSGQIKDLSIDFRTGKAKLMLELNEKQDAMNMFDELHQVEKVSLKIDKWRDKRSLNSNNYAWKLLTEIGNILRKNKEEVYFEMLQKYGQSEMISAKAHIPIKEFVKYCVEAGESTLNGTVFKHYKVYKGSSEFDKREMAIFLDGIIDDAKGFGIQTETPEQIAKMKSLWKAGE